MLAVLIDVLIDLLTSMIGMLMVLIDMLTTFSVYWLPLIAVRIVGTASISLRV